MARYAIGLLYRPSTREKDNMSSNDSEKELSGTIAGLEAMNFITVATPHLGSRGNKQVLVFICAQQSLFSCLLL